MLLHLDFSLNYSVYFLSTIKIHHVHADYKLHVETRIICIVRQLSEGASPSMHSGADVPASLFVPKK